MSKGSKRRPFDSERYGRNYDRIFRTPKYDLTKPATADEFIDRLAGYKADVATATPSDVNRITRVQRGPGRK